MRRSYSIHIKSSLNLYSNPIYLETTTGDITFENNSLTSQLTIETRSGNIYGKLFQSRKSELNIKTDDGYVDLNLNITKISNQHIHRQF